MAEVDEVTVTGSLSPTKGLTMSPTTKEGKQVPGIPTDDALLEEPVKSVPQKKIIQKITLETDPDKAAKRLERFGLPEKDVQPKSNPAAATKRQERFGVVSQKEAVQVKSDPVKAAKRAERFGVPEKDVIEVKKSKRALRFSSSGTASIPSTPEIEEKKKARAERFSKGSIEVEDKKKARSARFGAETN